MTNFLTIYDVVRYPVVTEKSTNLASQNKYIFKVDMGATKSQIKNAIEKLFNVRVDKVNTITVHGKVKRFRGILGRRNSFKKALVSVADGQKIDYTLGVN